MDSEQPHLPAPLPAAGAREATEPRGQHSDWPKTSFQRDRVLGRPQNRFLKKCKTIIKYHLPRERQKREAKKEKKELELNPTTLGFIQMIYFKEKNI